MSKVIISKRPDLLTSVPTKDTYMGLSQSELLTKVKALHESILKTNEYLIKMHKLSIYNWDVADTGNIMVELAPDSKGFLLDSVLRLRGVWDPATNTPELLEQDEGRIGWLYRVETDVAHIRFGSGWKTGDYALYDEQGKLYNVQARMLESMFTPIVPNVSNTVSLTVDNQLGGIGLKADVILKPGEDNDIKETPEGLYSDAFKRTQAHFTVREVAPTEPNTTGAIIIIYLQEEPEVFYDGYLYMIPPPGTIIT